MSPWGIPSKSGHIAAGQIWDAVQHVIPSRLYLLPFLSCFHDEHTAKKVGVSTQVFRALEFHSVELLFIGISFHWPECMMLNAIHEIGLVYRIRNLPISSKFERILERGRTESWVYYKNSADLMNLCIHAQRMRWISMGVKDWPCQRKIECPWFFIKNMSLIEQNQWQNDLRRHSKRVDGRLDPAKISRLEIRVDVDDLDLGAGPSIDSDTMLAAMVSLSYGNTSGLVMDQSLWMRASIRSSIKIVIYYMTHSIDCIEAWCVSQSITFLWRKNQEKDCGVLETTDQYFA